MRPTILAILVVTAIVALTACSANAQHPRRVSTGPTTSNSNVVDGITIPPPYVSPAGTVVPGPSSCPAAFATTLNAASRGGTFTLTTERTNHLITCKYRNARPARGSCANSTIMVNTEPNAFVAFDRWNVETGQNSMWRNDPKLQPVPVAGIGIEAEWVPELLELGAGNSTTWVSVFLTCPANTRAVLALAKVLAAEGLASTA